MLPKAHRLTNSEDFRRTVRSGQRSVTPTVVVHSAFDGGDDPARFGVTVSKSVGSSVVRHRVARQIRHGILGRLADVPSGSRWVIRALPAAGAQATGKAPSPGTDVQAGIELALRDAGR
ncbi:MAG: ribonuclease P protein component [Candidatus Nanopelagicales bacterium]|jgi:ribonuclease P protein component|nr:ribonuclease P protein component [Actinomycetota bacterium]NDG95955.1 ribonuclease P protein component [Actinomycetota bacterium]NDH19171.1 ribonuclease P protein component [Actinomycetota bacterium]